MIAIVFVAIAAGCASALMFASIISGALISLVLFYLAPLPLMVAALGWGPLSSTIGGIAAATGLGAVFGFHYCIAFVVMVALPAWWLGHLSLLGRPIVSAVTLANGASPAAPNLEWYPVGRILLWIAGIAALSTMAALLTLGADAASITGTLRRGLVEIIQIVRPRDLDSAADSERLIDTLVTIAPLAAVAVTTTTLTVNLWLSAKITATSGRLHRPWPDLKSTALPATTVAILCAAIAFCFAGGLVAILAQIVVAALAMAYAFLGFAVLHTLTLAVKGRAVWLGGAYTITVALIWPIIVLVLLGVADAVFGIRRRYSQARPPPPVPAS
jgi:hypothetical protein